MAAGPSISDTGKIAELIDAYRMGARGSDCPVYLPLSRVCNGLLALTMPRNDPPTCNSKPDRGDTGPMPDGFGPSLGAPVGAPVRL